MEILDLSLPSTNKFATDYINGSDKIRDFFDYPELNSAGYQKRMEDLAGIVFPRRELAEHIESYHRRIGGSPGPAVLSSLGKLRDERSLVVIGGQQAGLLSGPLYTIHKIISIIKLAEQQERELGVPVVPVFWIAGEDHDFAEINHLYINSGGYARKSIVPQNDPGKKMVSDLRIDKSVCWDWMEEIIETYGETPYTSDLLKTYKDSLDQSDTYVDFFARLINGWFSGSGVLLINSGSHELRKLESRYFEEFLTKNQEICEAVLSQQERLLGKGYGRTIEMQENAANLFYHLDGERMLLERTGAGFAIKSGHTFTLDHLLEVSRQKPEILSNNVVTRPLMQERLFPTLAFISGPGEAAYWAELQGAFSVLGMKMPPVVPRLMITFLERNIESLLEEVDIPLAEVLAKGTAEAKKLWVDSSVQYPIEETMAEAKIAVEEIHRKVRELGEQVDASLGNLLEKNAGLIQKQLDFAKKAIEKRVLLKHDVELKRFDRLELSLRPNGAPQERIWNISYYLNKYGFHFIDELMELPFEFNNLHKVIRL